MAYIMIARTLMRTSHARTSQKYVTGILGIGLAGMAISWSQSQRETRASLVSCNAEQQPSPSPAADVPNEGAAGAQTENGQYQAPEEPTLRENVRNVLCVVWLSFGWHDWCQI